jgi:hypothetical protein
MTGVYRYMFTIMPIAVCAAFLGSSLAVAKPIMLVTVLPAALTAWYLVRAIWPATRVIAVDGGLLVGAAEHSIPYSEIASVTQWIWNPELVTIGLRSGKVIRFFPRWRVRLGLGRHPIVDTLRTRAALR